MRNENQGDDPFIENAKKRYGEKTGIPPTIDELPPEGVEGSLSEINPKREEQLEEGVGTFTSRTAAGMDKVEKRVEEVLEKRKQGK